jgi:hypothetical protein
MVMSCDDHGVKNKICPHSDDDIIAVRISTRVQARQEVHTRSTPLDLHSTKSMDVTIRAWKWLLK